MNVERVLAQLRIPCRIVRRSRVTTCLCRLGSGLGFHIRLHDDGKAMLAGFVAEAEALPEECSVTSISSVGEDGGKAALELLYGDGLRFCMEQRLSVDDQAAEQELTQLIVRFTLHFAALRRQVQKNTSCTA